MNILFLAYEVESILLLEMSKLYMSEHNKTYMLNGDFWTYVNYPDFYSRHYNSFNCDYFNNFEDEYIALNKCDADVAVDFEYLANIEKTYNLSLNEIILTDTILYTASHNRDYFHVSPSNVKLKWVEFVIKKCLMILDEFKPDVILTVSNNYFVKNLVYHISKSKGIPFINTMNARVKDKFIATDNLSLNTSDFFIETMSKIEEKNKVEAEEFIKKISKAKVSSYDSHESLINAHKKSTLAKDVFLVARVNFFAAYNAITKKKQYRGYFKQNYLGAMYFSALWNNIRNVFRKHIFIKRFEFKKNLDENLKFYYFALHVIPESTILTQADDYKESSVIKDICAKLPIDTFLVVKENFEMLGDRPLAFYTDLSQIHNLILIDPFYSSIELIEKSKGTISMCGTVSFEACILDKRALVLGKPEYSALTGLELYNKYTTSFVSRAENTTNSNIREYIQTVLELGESLDYNYLVKANGWNNTRTDKFKCETKKLKVLYDRYIKLKVE